MQDSVRDRRLTVQRLTWEDVREIRLLYAEGTYTQAELGERYGVSQPHIHYIVSNKCWIETQEAA